MGLDRNRFARKGKGSEWVEWLQDDPLPERPVSKPGVSAIPQPEVHQPGTQAGRPVSRERLRMAGAHQTAQSTVAAKRKSSGISIQITMPRFKRPRLPRLGRKAWLMGGSAFALALVVGGVVFAAGHVGHKKPGVTKGGGEKASVPLSYKPLAPKDKPDLAANSSPSTRYDGQRQLYSFSDTLVGYGITVSEQPLPDAFKKDASAAQQAADGIGAKTTVETALGKAYIATDAKSGQQRVMLVGNDLLVFLQSAKKFDDDTWKYYIENLRQQ